MLLKFSQVDPDQRRSSRDTILDNAMLLFLDQGYDATTLDDVAKTCGITRPAVLYHYGSKEALLLEIVEPAIAAVAEAMVACEVSDRPTSRQREIAVRALLDAMLAHRPAVGVLSRFTKGHTTARLGERLQELNRRSALVLGGRDYETDPVLRVRVVAALAALSGIMGPRIPVSLSRPEERDALVAGLMALLEG